jgi:polysaccharide biosynthesis protein PslH
MLGNKDPQGRIAGDYPVHLLFLSHAFPLPANNGQKMRTWSLLGALADLGHDITLLTFGNLDQIAPHEPALQRVCREVEVVPLVLDTLSSTTNYLGRLGVFFRIEPFAVRRFVSPAMRTRIETHLARHCYDVVICDTIYSAVNLPMTGIPMVLNTHNVEHVILERYIPLERNPAKRAYAWIEMQKLRRWERGVLRRASIAMACSEYDQRLLSSLCPGVQTNVVPNIVDASTYMPSPEGDTRTILFQGGMDWFPNRDAVSFFAEHVLPVLRGTMPGIRFVVAGRNPTEKFRQKFRNSPEIEFTGTLTDIRPAIARATVCVVPLRIGSGTRLKILESAAMGKPVVSTRVGAEGLSFVDGEEIILADEPLDFVQAIIGLLQNPENRQAIGVAARRRVEEQYSVPSLRASIDQTLSRLPQRNIPVTSIPVFRGTESRVHP